MSLIDAWEASARGEAILALCTAAIVATKERMCAQTKESDTTITNKTNGGRCEKDRMGTEKVVAGEYWDRRSNLKK